MDKDILHKFFENRASVQQEQSIIEWLDKDPKNAEILFAERKMFDAVLLTGGGSEPQSRRIKLIRLTKTISRNFLRYAGVIAVAATASLLYIDSQREKMMMAMNTISVPAGQRVDITLSDGTKVCMNALSTLEYPAYFMGQERRVKLSGEAFFEVEHNKKQPFIVETFVCDVQVLGTKFNVDANPRSDEFETALLEGSVKVYNHDDPSQAVTLRPNERVSYSGGHFIINEIPEYETFQWREGLITFRNKPIRELFKDIETCYGITIYAEGIDISNMALTGKIRISDGVDHAMRVLQRSIPFHYERSGEDDAIIYIKKLR